MKIISKPVFTLLLSVQLSVIGMQNELKKDEDFYNAVLNDYVSENNQPKKSQKNNESLKKEPTLFETLKNWGGDLLFAYGTLMTLTAIHESGHALTNTLLYKDPFHINIGGHDSSSPILNFPGITLCGLNPLVGFISRQKKDDDRAWKHFIICLAGPIFGIIAAHFGSGKITKNYPLTKLATWVNITVDVLELLPIGDDSDGARALKFALKGIAKKQLILPNFYK